MSVLPKSLFLLGASLQTARTVRRLRRPGRAVPEQRAAFNHLVSRLASTQFGRESGIETGMDYARFRQRVPLRGPEQFAPFIERMKRGEADVLWPGTCSLYVMSAGTTDGHARWLPVTPDLLEHFRNASRDALLYYTARVGHSGLFHGRQLVLSGSTALAPVAASRPFDACVGELGAIAALNLPRWAERHFYEPGAAIAQLSDWTQKIEATVERTRRTDITLLAGLPNWLVAFAEALRERETSGKHRPVNLQAIWPNLECVVHSGVPLGPFQEELRRLAGPTVNFHEVYPACEAMIAAQDDNPAAGLRLITGRRVFFEFLPLRDYDATLPATLGSKTVPLEGVRSGEDYALVLTTPGGLCRYVLGDVVQFTSTTPPRLVYVGRTKLRLDSFGENVSERDLTDALTGLCHRHAWTITNFHVAPLISNTLTGQQRGRHEWWVELRPGTVATPTGPLIAQELDQLIAERNASYRARRQAGALDAPVVRLVMPGFFAHWLQHYGKIGGLNKMPRCRSDRDVANDLAGMACFNAD